MARTMTRRSQGKQIQAEHIDIEQVLSGITHGRHDCPIKDCPEWFWTVGDKKRHLRVDHPESKRS